MLHIGGKPDDLRLLVVLDQMATDEGVAPFIKWLGDSLQQQREFNDDAPADKILVGQGKAQAIRDILVEIKGAGAVIEKLKRKQPLT